jgi:hypothetical protein
MALFSDGPPATVEDLTAQDSFLLSVASTEGINITSKIALAYNELGIEITAIFGREASIYAPVLGEAPLDTNHLFVSPAIKLWLVFKSLALVYRDCYFNQLNDRYKAKWLEYQNQAGLLRTKFIETGAGLVVDPISPPATVVAAAQPGSGSAGTAYIASTWTNSEGEESSPSPTVELTLGDQQQASVSVSGWPSNAAGWNFYAGQSPAGLTLQNPAVLSLGTSYVLVLPPTESGAPIGTGQVANVTRDLPRRIMRG